MSTSDNEDEGEEEGKAEREEDDDLESASAMMKAKRAACKRKAGNGGGERIKAASCSSEGDCPELCTMHVLIFSLGCKFSFLQLKYPKSKLT